MLVPVYVLSCKVIGLLNFVILLLSTCFQDEIWVLVVLKTGKNFVTWLDELRVCIYMAFDLGKSEILRQLILNSKETSD